MDEEKIKKIIVTEIEKCTKNIIKEIKNYNEQLALDDVLTVSEAADMYKVATSTIRDLARNKTICAKKSGSTWLFRKKDLDSYFK